MSQAAGRHIAVVGGGTAGWLAALVLAFHSADADSGIVRVSR